MAIISKGIFICLFIIITLSLVKADQTPPHKGQCSQTPVNGLLQSLGYSPTCVSAALSLCGTSDETSGHSSLQGIFEELAQDLRTYTKAIIDKNEEKRKPTNCLDLLKEGYNTSGLYTIYPYSCCCDRAVTVYCDQTTDGGGWTVIQRRVNLEQREDFARSWTEYSLGFGHLKGEFWLGLDNIHALTKDNLMELRVDLEDYENQKRYAKYGKFFVDSAATNYKLSVGRYSGDAGDGFLNRHDGHAFSTIDRDHDTYKENCAKLYPGGWWFDACHISNINGKPLVGAHKSYADGINWRPFKDYHYSLKKTYMMVRPAFDQHEVILPLQQ